MATNAEKDTVAVEVSERADPLLILDDEKEVLDVLKEHLTGQGYPCTCTTSPLQALEILETTPHALLVTDLKMPELSGIEVVKRIRSVDPDIPIIVITGLTGVTNAIEAMRAGADDYVLKPFNLTEISLSVSRGLDKRRLITENRRYQQELEDRVGHATAELEQTNRDLASTRDHLQSLIDSTVDAIITIDENDVIAFANRGAQRMLGLSEEELTGIPVADIYIGGKEEVRYIDRVLEVEKPLQNYETELRHKQGHVVPASMSISLLPSKDGRGPSKVAICKDITEQKRLEKELKEMTIRDSLTGLYNQRYFYDRMEAEVERAKRQKRPLSLLLIDLDGFKSYNDSHGHLEGDKVLQAVGEVIHECTREHVDLAFRYGGDEFMVILPEAPESQARQIAERIRETFEAKRFDLMTMSVGLMAYRDGQSIRKFIQFTDSMMYDAKRAGGNRVYVYQPDN